jgi:hypothetical protein
MDVAIAKQYKGTVFQGGKVTILLFVLVRGKSDQIEQISLLSDKRGKGGLTMT